MSVALAWVDIPAVVQHEGIAMFMASMRLLRQWHVLIDRIDAQAAETQAKSQLELERRVWAEAIQSAYRKAAEQTEKAAEWKRKYDASQAECGRRQQDQERLKRELREEKAAHAATRAGGGPSMAAVSPSSRAPRPSRGAAGASSASTTDIGSVTGGGTCDGGSSINESTRVKVEIGA